MNKKGFTLVELLAVIIILSALALLASTSVTNVVRNSKSDLYNSQINLIKSAAEAWGADNINKLPSEGTCKYLTLSNLQGYGLVEPSIINPKTNQEFSGDMKIKIMSEATEYGTSKLSYEVGASSVSSCSPVYVCQITRDQNSNKIADIGDGVKCENNEFSEEFYVMDSYDEQLILMKKTKLSGNIAFSDFNYWYNSNAGVLYPQYGTLYPTSVYVNSNVKLSVDNYAENLKAKGLNILSASVPSLEQLEKLGCSKDSLTCNSAPAWVYETSYWTTTAVESDKVLTVSSTNRFEPTIHSDNQNFGVRPIIIISKTDVL